MTTEEKAKAFDEVKSIAEGYFDKLVNQGYHDPDDMDHDCFFEEIMTEVLGEDKWKRLESLPYGD